MGIALTLHIVFGNMAISSMLILPIHEQRRSLQILVSSWFYFFSVLEFSLQISLIKFTLEI
jgi:hypothetical protein